MLQTLAHYQIEELIGEGSFAWVYRAVDEKFERFVALKVLKPVWLNDPQAIARFKQEAIIMAKLRHPHIVDVFDVGDAGGQIYLSQLLVEGETLADRLARGPLMWDEMVHIITAIGSALDYAHGQGIIHRDVKPQNILLDKHNQAFLGDFGLVRAVEGSTHLSSTVSMIGTYHYMAPEVWRGKQATPATDVYALSCVVSEVLTGKILFEGSSMAELTTQHVVEGPQLPESWPEGVPAGVTDVLKRGLYKDPAKRINSARGLVAALEAVSAAAPQPKPAVETAPPAVKATPPPEPAPKSTSASPPPAMPEPQPVTQPAALRGMNKGCLFGGGAVLLVIVGAIIFFSTQTGPPRQIVEKIVTVEVEKIVTLEVEVGPVVDPDDEPADEPEPEPLAEEATRSESPAAKEGETLKLVRTRGILVCGANQSLPGFGYLDPDTGNFNGFDIDLCRAIAAAVLGDANAHEIRAVTAQERFRYLQGGEIDILIRNTTWTFSRDTALGLNFGPTTFYDGQGIMVRKDSGVTQLEDMEGATICVQAETTTEMNLADVFQTRDIYYEPIVFADSPSALAAYDEGRCDGFTTDKSGLIAGQFLLSDPEAHTILEDTFSKEPLGPVVRHGDDQWFDIVQWVVFGLMTAEEYGVTSDNVESLAATSADPAIRKLLGVEGNFGQALALDDDFMVKAIKQVGSYGQIYDRNLGSGTIYELKRGLNALQTQGGLIYVPLFKESPVAPTGSPARGPGTTLSAVQEKGVLNCGIATNNNFSDGFNIDFCKAVAGSVLKDSLAIEIQIVTLEEGLVLVQDGDIDLLGGVPWTIGIDTWLDLNFAAIPYYDESNVPVGFVVRQGDDNWYDIVKWVIFGTFQAEELGITSANVEETAANSEYPVIRYLLGVEGDLGLMVALNNDFMVKAIKQVGNYNEIYHRHMGSRLRGPNALWTDGGLIYSPPFR